MFRKVILVAALATVLSSSLAAQELSRLEFNTGQFDATQRQARVDTLPSGYFAEQTSEVAELPETQANTRLQNLFVIAGFGSMLLVGGIITTAYLVKRRGARKTTAPPPVRLYV